MLDALERVFFAAFLGGVAMAGSLMLALVLSAVGAQMLSNLVLWPGIVASVLSHWLGTAQGTSPQELEREAASAGFVGLILGFGVYAAIAYACLRKWKRA